MTPPEAPIDGNTSHRDTPPAVSVRLDILKVRADFVAASRARRQASKGMMVQARKRRPDESVPSDAIRVGFTCTKKVGNAVARNRAKRRLREVARLILPTLGRPGWDYVLVGRFQVTDLRPFEDLKGDLKYALKKLHTDGS
ncbi:ribonuclease P protein component [Shimia litoralis]|uniref:Ribonuclease P protein component n=1 Tax=Shimia litoralis TaxID=420403 RepID=A0A4U7N5B1_9RHOB|nr:ribonuclease P protein component [Shimia litoralis]TKZ20985.1 ribonuclease P protein component [Shimia litoralis]